MNRFPIRIASLIFNQAQAVLPSTMDLVTQWANHALNLNLVNVNLGGMPSPMAMDDDVDYGARKAARDAERLAAAHATGVQVVPVHGLLVPRSTHMDPCEQSTSYEDLRAQLVAAMQDPMIEHIVMDVDSPGGSVAGCFELADDIHAWAQQKPITAVVNYGGYSAAYALSSAASHVVVSPSSGVGSIGVIARHVDMSKRNEANGMNVTTIYAGAHKNDLSPHEPLSDQSAEFLRQMVNASYDRFVGAVARYRGIDEQAVRNTEAQVYFGNDGVSAGLADAVEAPQAAVNRIAADVAAARSGRKPPSASVRKASIAARAAAVDCRARA
jgi:signal peptide peptidase SppA